MNSLELVSRLTALLTALTGVVTHTLTLMPLVRALGPHRATRAYENVLLELVWDISDRHGKTATLKRRQRVRFLHEDADVVRDIVWGEGSQLARYHARGARRLVVRPEGSRRAVLLGVNARPRVGAPVLVASKRVIEDGFLAAAEYCEVMVERPTQRLVVTVIFPPGRPPKETHLATVPSRGPDQRVPVRYAADGRAYVRWSRRTPTIAATYSLRWSW